MHKSGVLMMVSSQTQSGVFPLQFFVFFFPRHWRIRVGDKDVHCGFCFCHSASGAAGLAKGNCKQEVPIFLTAGDNELMTHRGDLDCTGCETDVYTHLLASLLKIKDSRN